jgi:hypothetical protein
MKQVHRCLFISLVLVTGLISMSYSSQFIPANNPSIQYFGRWDFSDPLHPKHSWPGVSISAEFTGTSIGIRMSDHINYYNVFIDGTLHSVFHGNGQGEADYILADSLNDTRHTLRLSKRNIVINAVFSFSGILLDDSGAILPPAPRPKRKIEFIGDSFTVAESNEATVQELAWEDRFPVTNSDKGFAPLTARHYGAEYHLTCRSGIGMVCDWQGKTDHTLPMIFHRTLMEAPEPIWNFTQWIPDLVVIALGLNDYSGLKDKNGNVSEEKSALFRKGYRDFLETIRGVYPGVRILAVSAFPEWIRTNIRRVVEDEKRNSKTDIEYAQYDEFPGGYVAYGHPTVETHRKMADQIITAIDSLKIFSGR